MLKPIKIQKLIQHLTPKNIPSPPRRDRKARLILLRVAPHQITKRPIMRDLLEAFQTLDLLDRLDHRGEAAMDREDCVIDVYCDGEIVEDIGVGLPDDRVAVLCLALHVEPVVLGYCTRLVIPSDHRHSLRILNLQQAQQCNNLDTMRPPIDIIP